MISGIILAAGKGSRMGNDKLALPLEGKPILEHVIMSAKQSKLDEIILVWGRYRSSKELAEKYGIYACENKGFEMGMSTSIISGLGCISPQSEGVMFLLGDMPFVKALHINGLIETYEKNPKGIVMPMCDGKRGNPVLFSKIFYEELKQLKGDIGARGLITKHMEQVTSVTFYEDSTLRDIDTQEEYGKYRRGI
ncbi:molybdenum cofactor cytidylyltransferase [Anaerosolibacter carboniphilus]|uniref:Molybdenum cofactor cytidylyltransferase n=1 Tax=Anaerosolibacter carboniphilus TaxID=1417629 RepID=A0A841KY46_9FIRM|nr:molybdenum cofactor cytidylyltransferase [Anaerosolibacter carboniphilus]MBB6216910.1 molybdenum cofactor cytidylyltransferase [Anaerosolibacter carboniphilus]